MVSRMRGPTIPTIAVALLITAANAHAAPAWCKGATEKVDVSEYDLKRLPEEADARSAVKVLVGANCFPNGDTKAGAKVVSDAFAKWSKQLGMTDADWADGVDYVNKGGNGAGTSFPRDAKVPWSKWSAGDQYVGIKGSTMGNSAEVSDPEYVADALGAKLTELGRAAYIAECIKGDDKTGRWAVCQGDIDALDRAKVAADLRGDTTWDGVDKMTMRMELVDLWANLDKHLARVKELKAKDPGYAKLFEAAAAGRKTAGDAKLLDLVMSMDEARISKSRKSTEGCAEKTWGAFRDAVGAIPAKSFADIVHDPEQWKAPPLEQAMGIVSGTPNGYLASLALYLCSSAEGKEDYLARSIGEVIEQWPGFRGPRNAAHTALLTAGIQLDDRDAKIGYPEISRPWIGRSTGSSGGGWGEVAGVKPAGDTTTIEFAKVKSKQQECTKGHYTNRLQQIRSDGSLVYEYRCESYKTVTINEPPFDAQKVKSRYADGVKKGMTVDVVEDVVTFAYPKPGVSTPSAVAGAAVK